MLLNGEMRWLYGYLSILMAGVVACAVMLPLWTPVVVGVGGLPVAFFFWLWQVGRYG